MKDRRPALAVLITLVALSGSTGCRPQKESRDPEPLQSQDLVDSLPFARVVSARSESAPLPVPEERGFFLPYRVSVEFFLDLGPGSKLTFGCRVPRRGSGRLEVTRATDDEGEHLLVSVDRTVDGLSAVLTEVDSSAVRLTFRAIGPEGSEDQGVLIREAEIRAPIAAGGHSLAGTAKQPSRMPPPVVIFLVDTLRPDHLGAYGYQRPVSPHLDRFAEHATLFEYAVGQSSWTKPSVASIFTGLWPLSHGAVGRKDRLADAQTVVAELLGAAGYRTAAIFTNPNVSKAFGFDQGFDHVVELVGEETDSGAAVGHATEWIEGLDESEAFFLYLHTQDPHHPYLPPEEYRQAFAADSDEAFNKILERPRKETWGRNLQMRDQLLALYDAEIAANDASFGRLIGFLEERDLYDDSMIVFVSDHGEEFLEHKRWGHGRNLHSSELNVALLIKHPAQSAPARVSQPAQHVDILPTILRAVGLEGPASLEGRDLRSLGGGERVFSHLQMGGQSAVISGSFKLLQRREQGRVAETWLFDWQRDALETENLVDRRPILASALAVEMEKKMSRGRAPRESVTLDPRLEERLRALGYLE